MKPRYVMYAAKQRHWRYLEDWTLIGELARSKTWRRRVSVRWKGSYDSANTVAKMQKNGVTKIGQHTLPDNPPSFGVSKDSDDDSSCHGGQNKLVEVDTILIDITGPSHGLSLTWHLRMKISLDTTTRFPITS
ncbi:hypothetical protein C5167_002707 [Papaver somniferum]|uniref:Uncharacterized protein n=1 Tax=Papaver somniferum TaxID=3469 RepID=A0A4Y7L2R1_PAPSO|nr:hypothetical protein C5167_002707 [Papaver somniferum]